MAKLKDLSVSFLSLVRTPATGKALTLKSAKPGERAATFEIIKTDDERMVAYGIVYAPDQEDAHGDTADAVTIRRAAYEFMREARLKNIDTEHSFNASMAFVAESWLLRKGDALFPGEPEGSWAVGIQIGDPDLWKQLKSGDLTGISLAGIARMEPKPDDPASPRYTEKTKEAAPGWVERLIKALSGAETPEPVEEKDMDKEKVREIVRETLKSEIGDAVKDALKSADTGGNDDPKTGSDPAPKDDPKKADPKDAGADVETAVAKAIEGLESRLDDRITKALAKGALESDPARGVVEEGFA